MNLAMQVPVLGASCAVLALPGTTIHPLEYEMRSRLMTVGSSNCQASFKQVRSA